MSVAWRVRTFYLAQATFVAKVHYTLIFRGRQLADVIAFRVNCLEQGRKRRAKVKTQPAAMAYIEDSLDFLVELGALPVLCFIGIIGQAIGGFGFDSAAHRYK